jgi:hypothetical protein
LHWLEAPSSTPFSLFSNIFYGMTIVIFEYVKTRAIAYGTFENAWMSVAWDDLRTVLMLVRHRTLAGAAKATGVNYTTVARRVRRAEEANGSLARHQSTHQHQR